MKHRIFVRAATAITAVTLGLAMPPRVGAQDSGDGPAVGQVAPDFTVLPVGKDGPMPAPITLSAMKGQTVVIAFFPKARTPGCTTQMTAYRDQYPDLFNGGKNVMLLGVSTDSHADLIAWAKDAGFPFAFVSDHDGKIGKAYGALTPLRMGFSKRLLFVVGPDGKVAYKATPFRQSSADAYTELAQAIDKVAAR